MRNIIVTSCRIFVGVLFILSGLVKLNDPVGFSYKLEEYFSEPVFNMPSLIPFAVSFAVFIVILEIILGIMLLLGTKPKITIWLLIVLMVEFTFLTFYSAFFEVVKECGCFGDAIPLTSWQSFIKDLVLLTLILVIYFNLNQVKTLFTTRAQVTIILASLALSSFMGYWVINHLPLVDFRPYKVGTNIAEGMKIPENAQKSVVEMIFIYDVNGEKKEYTEKDLSSIPEGAVFIDRVDKVISEGYIPPIHDFTIEQDGYNYAEDFLGYPKLMLFLMYDINKTNRDVLKHLQNIYKKASKRKFFVIALSASSPEDIKKLKEEFHLSFDFYFCDGITIKTIERANPGVVKIEYGVIKQKVHYNDLDKLTF